jgi:hypothetical protein
MNLSKWANITKVILLKVVEEIERRINEKNGRDGSDHLSSSIYTSLKFIILEQVDGLVDDVIVYTRKQINDLSTLIAEKTAIILASVVYILLLLGFIFLAFIFFAIALSLYLGSVLGQNYMGFIITGAITALITIILYLKGHKTISGNIKRHLTNLIQ